VHKPTQLVATHAPVTNNEVHTTSLPIGNAFPNRVMAHVQDNCSEIALLGAVVCGTLYYGKRVGCKYDADNVMQAQTLVILLSFIVTRVALL